MTTKKIEAEIDTNQAAFRRDWASALKQNLQDIDGNKAFIESYRRITALQAIKSYIISQHYSVDSAAFYFEAHNDALVSHVAASFGAWRPALQSLRSCIENMLCAIYYNEHPIELELWGRGSFVIGFSDLMKYLERHPRLIGMERNTTGLEAIKVEYAMLSKAVHGSAQNFRMTDAVSSVLLWSADNRKASQWSTREAKAIRAICMLLVCRHSDLLKGTKLAPLRDVLGFALGAADKKKLKAIGVNVA